MQGRLCRFEWRRWKKERAGAWLWLALCAAALSHSCATSGSAGAAATSTASAKLAGSGWYGNNRELLAQFLTDYGKGGKFHDGARAPVAVFDWDNTIIKNDIGDGMVFWMLRHGKYLQPAEQDWDRTSRWLTPQAVSALTQACGTDVPAGEPLPTHENLACADEILSVYHSEATTSGEPAFVPEGYSHRQMVPAYAWAAQLLGGYTTEQVRDLANQAIESYLRAPVDTPALAVGSQERYAPAYIRVYEPMRELIAQMQAQDIDVWVVSASPHLVVETFASRVGIGADRVVGIRTVVAEDAATKTLERLTYQLEGCGLAKDGDDTVMTYVEGKRCWVNKAIFGVPDSRAMQRQLAADKRPVFAAGDATTDISFLQDATALRLVINRNKHELMCYAYANADGKWLVNPMFISPYGARVEPYPCASVACKAADGREAPCQQGDGTVIANQTDRVYASDIAVP